jgi:hypothetical protein
MFSIPSALAVLASLGLLWADVPTVTVDDTGTQVAKRRARRHKAPARAPAVAPEEETALPIGPSGRANVIMETMRVNAQTTSPGELKVMNRKPADLTSMVRMRREYRSEIIQTVFPLKAVRE